MIVVRLFLAVPRVCLQFVIVVFPEHTHLLFWYLPHILLGVNAVFYMVLLSSVDFFSKLFFSNNSIRNTHSLAPE